MGNRAICTVLKVVFGVILTEINSKIELIRIYVQIWGFIDTSHSQGVRSAMVVIWPEMMCLVHGCPSMRFFHQPRSIRM